jgi:hypothetical protein
VTDMKNAEDTFNDCCTLWLMHFPYGYIHYIAGDGTRGE